MDTEKEFKNLVALYVTFDDAAKCYKGTPDKAALLNLDEHFTKLINKLLLEDGPEIEAIDKNRKKLASFFHPGKSQLTPEVVWLEQSLSEGRNDGMCFKTLGFCFEKLIAPQNFKEIQFKDIKNRDEFKQWLQGLRDEAGTYTIRSLYDSLIGLLDQAGGYFDDVGQIQPKGLRLVMTCLPITLASYGAVLFSEQLFIIYTLYFIMLKGGQYLERNRFDELQALGKTLQGITIITATATTTLVVRLLEMTFWASRQCYHASLQIGSALLNPLLQQEYASNICADLKVASTNLNEGMHFDTPALKLIAAPLESYLGLNAQQYLASWRLGGKKRLNVDSVLFSMRVIDKLDYSLEEKLKRVEAKLVELKENKKVYVMGSETAKAVDRAFEVISFLTEKPSETKMIDCVM